MSDQVTFPPGLRRFASVSAFYADDESREKSPEREYGVFWWDGPQGHSATWRVAALESTGEIYATRVHGYRRRDEEQVVLLGKLAEWDPEYLKADGVLEGWNLEVGKSSSLQWVLDRVLAATGEYPAPISVLCRFQLLGRHVHVQFFVGRQPGSRGQAGELILEEDEWAVFLAGLQAGFGDRLELRERDGVGVASGDAAM